MLVNIFRPSQLNLKSKLILLYFLTIFIPLIVIGQILLTISGNKIIEQTTNLTEGSSQQSARNIQNLLDQYVNIVGRLCLDPALNNYLNITRVYNSELESIDAYSLYLRPVTFYDFNYKEPTSLKIYFLNDTLLQDGNTFIHADSEERKLPEYTAAVKASGDVVWGLSSNQIYVARAMYNLQRQLIAVVTIQIPESRLNSLILETDKSEKKTLITTGAGDVVSANFDSSALRTVSGRSYFRPDDQQPFDISDDQTGKPYKVVIQKLGDGEYYPDWRLLTLIPLNRLINDERTIRRTGLLVISLGLLVSCGIFLLSLGHITSRLKMLVKKMQVARNGQLSTIEDGGGSDEIGVLTNSFNLMIKSLQKSIFENYEVNLKLKDITIKKQEAELYALQNQINPHFLFNTLESIRMGLHNKGDGETAKIVLNLSKLFRHSLNWQGEFIRLRDEIELVQRYLSIQKYRFAEKLSYSLEVPEWLEDACIPKFTVQPIVENAVKHGIESIRDNGKITVKVEADAEESMTITVEDNGVGIPPDVLSGIQQALAVAEIKMSGSIGLKNVHDRIALHFGNGYGLMVESDAHSGTRIRISMPILFDIRTKQGDDHVQDTHS